MSGLGFNYTKDVKIIRCLKLRKEIIFNWIQPLYLIFLNEAYLYKICITMVTAILVQVLAIQKQPLCH